MSAPIEFTGAKDDPWAWLDPAWPRPVIMRAGGDAGAVYVMSVAGCEAARARPVRATA